MHPILITNDMVVLSYAEAVLAEYGIETLVFDRHISIVEGSIGAFPRRLMVSDDGRVRAARLLQDAGLQAFLVTDGTS